MDWSSLPTVLTAHVFDKIRALDMTLAEFEQLLDIGEVIEQHEVSGPNVKELILVVDWHRPLHVVAVIDLAHDERRIITVYEPDAGRWSPDFRSRR